MSAIVDVAVRWLAQTGAPNWLLILALLTHPATWGDALRSRGRPLLDRVLPTRGEGSA